MVYQASSGEIGGFSSRMIYAGACPHVFVVSVPVSSCIPAMGLDFRNVGFAAPDEILKSLAVCVLGRCRNQR